MATDANDSACNIKVVCRVRPLNELEKRNGYGNIVKTSNYDGVNIQVGDRSVCPGHQIGPPKRLIIKPALDLPGKTLLL